MRTKYRKISVLLLSIIFLFAVAIGPSFLQVHAVATGLSVLAALAFASLVGWGVVTVCNGLTAQDLDSWMVEEMGLWAANQNSTLDQLIPEFGIFVNAIGDLILTPTAALGLTQFDRWLISKYGVTAGGSSVTVIGDDPAMSMLVLSGTKKYIGSYSSGRVSVSYNRDCWVCVRYADLGSLTQYALLTLSQDPSPVSRSQYVDNGGPSTSLLSMTSLSSRPGWYYAIADPYKYNDAPDDLNVPVYDSVESAVDAIVGSGSSDGTMELVPDTNISIPTSENAAKDTNISWGGSTGMTVQSAADTILNQVVDNSLNVTITQTGEGVDNPTQSWPEVDRPIGVEGLASVFPFCIPFDIVDFLTLLEAERQTPVFDFELVFVPLGIDEHVVLDFTMFNDLAAMVRTAELFLFIVGLAIVTRQIFAKG